MLRVSDYNISLPLINKDSEYIMVHGYSGAFDVVSPDIYSALEEAKTNTSSLSTISPKNLAVLEKRGYVTHKTPDEEKRTLRKISEAIRNIQSKIVEITIVPTYNCNFRCVYCFEKRLFEKGKSWLGKLMSYDTVDSIFNQVRLYKEQGKIVKGMTLFGGEPLLKKNYKLIGYIVNKSRDQEIPVTAITNGYELDYFYNLLAKDKISTIQITLDGGEKAHNERRFLAGGQPTFQKIIDNINRCIEKDIKIVIRSNVNKKNFQEIEKLITLYKENKWNEHTNISCYFKATHACYEEPANVVSDIRLMKELSDLYGDVNQSILNSFYKNLTATIFNMLSKKGIAPLKASYCGANMGMQVVDPFGDIYPCWDLLGKQDEVIGTVDNKLQIFELNERSEYWTNRTVTKIPKCIDCKYSLFCGGGCAAFAKISGGDFYSSYCDNFATAFNEIVPNVYKYYVSLTDGMAVAP